MFTRRIRRKLTRGAFCAAAVALVALVWSSASPRADTVGVVKAKEIGNAFSDVARQSAPAVVFVESEKSVMMNPAGGRMGTGDPFGGELFRQFFGRNFSTPAPEQHMEGQGSGFIVSEEGYILTNNHVVDGADKVTVRLDDGRDFDAKVVGTDPHTDVAVIKIDGHDLPTLPLGDSDQLEVGEWVLALGNPFGLSNTLTAGIVSAKGRSRIGITDYEDFIQTDAAINPGNSGGPLIDLDGRVVGINTAIATRTGGYMGVGFAIPISLASAIERQIIDHGSVTRGHLGVVIQDLTPDLATSLAVEGTKGVLVSEVEEDSPAAEAGLRTGDIIVALDGSPVERVEELRNRIALTAPEDKVELTYLRDGRRQTVRIEVGKQSGSDLAGAVGPGQESAHDLGLEVQELSGDLARQLGFVGQEGVLVTNVASGSVADRAGIRPGMLIQQVDRQTVSDVSQFRDALEASKGNRVLLLVRDDRAAHFVVLER